MNSAILVGTISNAENNLRSDLLRLLEALSFLDLKLVYLVESDSNDSTLTILQECKSRVVNFDFVSLGVLKDIFPDRITRIRHCRNLYVKKIKLFMSNNDVEYVVVADLDGMNSRISIEGIRSSFVRDDWGVVTANQIGGYYDLLALRHKTWCPGDVFEELRLNQSEIDVSPLPKLSIIRRLRRRLAFDSARKRAIYSKMKIIKKSSEWIEVSSSFGGLGIYKANIFERFDYSLLSSDSPHESEHVALSKRITESGQKIFINPAMTNNYFNTYNINRYFLIRQFRELFWNARSRIKL
jgi:hypothetical protein